MYSVEQQVRHPIESYAAIFAQFMVSGNKKDSMLFIFGVRMQRRGPVCVVFDFVVNTNTNSQAYLSFLPLSFSPFHACMHALSFSCSLPPPFLSCPPLLSFPPFFLPPFLTHLFLLYSPNSPSHSPSFSSSLIPFLLPFYLYHPLPAFPFPSFPLCSLLLLSFIAAHF